MIILLYKYFLPTLCHVKLIQKENSSKHRKAQILYGNKIYAQLNCMLYKKEKNYAQYFYMQQKKKNQRY